MPSPDTERLEFRILGPVEVAANGERLALGGLKQRALLALLLLHANEVVSRDRIIDELWGERPPATVAAALNVYISKLRKILGAAGAPDILATEEPGYVLRVESGQLDSNRFGKLAAEGKQALEAGEYGDAADVLQKALSLWRGPALDDLPEEEFARIAGARLEEGRLAAMMDRIEAALARGHSHELLGDLETLVAEHPLQERLWAELMLALYRSGRQAEALEAYRRAQETLAELGIEPSRELKQLQSHILRQDPALQAPLSLPRSRGMLSERARPRWTRRRLLALVAGVLLAGALAGIAIAWSRGGHTSAVVAAPNSIRVIDLATNKALATVPVGGTPGGLSTDREAVWVANEDDDTVLRIDPATMDVVQTIGAAGVSDVAAGAGALWAVTADGAAILRIQPEHPDLSRVLPIDKLSEIWDPAEVQRWIAFGAGSVWTLNGSAGLARIDPTSGDLVSRIGLAGSSPDELVFGAGYLWIVDLVNHQLIKVDPKTERVVRSVTVGKSPVAVAVGYGSVWVADYRLNVVWRFNPILELVEGSFPVGLAPVSVAVGGGFVWVANTYDSTVTKIDPRTNRVVRTIPVGYQPTRVVVGHGKLWVITR